MRKRRRTEESRDGAGSGVAGGRKMWGYKEKRWRRIHYGCDPTSRRRLRYEGEGNSRVSGRTITVRHKGGRVYARVKTKTRVAGSENDSRRVNSTLLIRKRAAQPRATIASGCRAADSVEFYDQL